VIYKIKTFNPTLSLHVKYVCDDKKLLTSVISI